MDSYQRNTFCFTATFVKGSEEEVCEDVLKHPTICRNSVKAPFKMCDSKATVCNLPSTVIFLSLFVCTHYIYFPPFFSQPPFLWLSSPLRYYPLCQHGAFPWLRACRPPPYNVIKDRCNANRCLEMVYVKSALKCHTAHTTFFYLTFSALMERVRGPPAGSWVRSHKPDVQMVTGGSLQSGLWYGTFVPGWDIRLLASAW